MTEPADTQPERVVLLRFAYPIPAALFADLLSAVDETLRLHGWSEAELLSDEVDRGALSAVPPQPEAAGRHAAEEEDVRG